MCDAVRRVREEPHDGPLNLWMLGANIDWSAAETEIG
jgi:hypothetical protein